LACACALLAVAVAVAAAAAPAGAVSVNPIGVRHLAPALEEVHAELVAPRDLGVTFDRSREVPASARTSRGPSVLHSDDRTHGFGFERDRLGSLESPE
jgi:hypothetical protein